MISDFNFKPGKLYEVIATFYNFGTCFQVGDFLVYLEEKEPLIPGVIELIFLSPQHGRVLFPRSYFGFGFIFVPSRNSRR